MLIIAQIFVNYGGGACSFFQHAPWYGVTAADVVFPAFVFIMGMSIALSTRSRLTANKDFLLLVCKVLLRSGKLFALGLVLNTDHSSLSDLRIPGVLQRLAISYCFVALLHVLSVFRANQLLSRADQVSMPQLMAIFAPEFAAHLALLLIYLFFTFWFNYADGCPKGYQGPGGLEDHSRFFNCTGGAANYLDRLVLGSAHMYQTPSSQSVYQHSLPHDPEGLLGCTTSILLTEFGLLCGRVLIKVRSHQRRVAVWLALALAVASVAAALSATALVPVVKNLWSLSFVCATGGLALLFFTLFYVLVDATRVWPMGAPLHCAGSNAVLLYVGHLVLGRYFPFSFRVAASHAHLLAQVSFACCLWLLVAVYAHRKNLRLVL